MVRGTRIFLMLVAAGSLAILPGCSGKNAATGSSSQKNDSAPGTDSSSLTVAAQPAHPLTYEQFQGKFLFTKYCAVCHGEYGKGDGFNAFNLDPKPRDFTDTTLMKALADERIAQTIRGGGRSVNKSHLMPAWGGRLKKEEIEYLVTYIRQFGFSK